MTQVITDDYLQELLETTRQQARVDAEKARRLEERNKIEQELLVQERIRNRELKRLADTVEFLSNLVKKATTDHKEFRFDLTSVKDILADVVVPALLNHLEDKSTRDRLYDLVEKIGTAREKTIVDINAERDVNLADNGSQIGD